MNHRESVRNTWQQAQLEATVMNQLIQESCALRNCPGYLRPLDPGHIAAGQ